MYKVCRQAMCCHGEMASLCSRLLWPLSLLVPALYWQVMGNHWYMLSFPWFLVQLYHVHVACTLLQDAREYSCCYHPSGCLNGWSDKTITRQGHHDGIVTAVIGGKVQLVYITPENILSKYQFCNMPLGVQYQESFKALVVEPHCIKLWYVSHVSK